MNIPFPLPRPIIEDALKRAFAEDFGDAGDITTASCIAGDAQMSATINARKEGKLAGITVAANAFHVIDPTLKVETLLQDGSTLSPGDKILTVCGHAQSILMAERVALNFLGRLCGVATATHDLVQAIDGTNAKIVCTRKTTPGLRAFEKHAVRCGGGYNHRFGLYDAVLIKDNHIAACGSITKTLQRAKAAIGHTVKIEIEVDTLDQLKEVLDEGADIVLLDNMTPDQLKQAVALTKGRCVLEASGNVTKATARDIAATGVDYISSGWITHSAPCLDIGLDAH